jgi:hypothetical protein
MLISMTSVGDKKSRNLAGVPAGRHAFGKLLALTVQEPLSPEPLYLDFSDIAIATASYLRESVLHFKDAVRRRGSNLYPVVANANEQVVEELALLIEANHEALMTCSLDEQGRPIHPVLLGDLDPKQKLTLELVNRIGETDASELMRDHNAGENVKQTAWNNRLSALAEQGLVFEVCLGREKRYKRLFEEGIYGN